MTERDRPASSSATLGTPALKVITEQLQLAIAAPKCHGCGCLQQTVEALARADGGDADLAPVLAQARSVFVPKKYDCLGCAVCYPAIAANAFTQANPEGGEDLDLCPTDEPAERQGWPPLPGDYRAIRYTAPVAACTLNGESLATDLAAEKPNGLSIVGTLRTENLGIERVIKNTLANPYIRFLVLCGEDTQQAVGHLPGQSLESLFRNGIDERGRIIGARGKRPVLKNVSPEEVQAFVQQVELVPMLGEENPHTVAERIRACSGKNPGANPHPFNSAPTEHVQVTEPKPLVLDKAGYFVVYPDHRAKRLMVEHYTNQGVLTCVLEGSSPGALYGEAIDRRLVTRLDHAAYLGQELARAEGALEAGETFIQDRAPGEVKPGDATHTGCGCGSNTCMEKVDE